MFLFPWLLFCTTLSFSPGAKAFQKSSVPAYISDWIKVAPPKVGSEAWNAAGASETEWQVEMKEGRPAAHLRNRKAEEASALPALIKRNRSAHPEPGEIHSVAVSDGWLIAYNPGDGSGGLWWYAADGRQRYKISNDQIGQFLPTKRGEIFALEGLAQGRSSRGQIVQIQRSGQGQWLSSQFVDLGHAPEVGMIDKDGSFLGCAADTLIRVQPDKTQTVLVAKAFWEGLSPRSIAVSPTGDIYLGMHEGVAQIYPFSRAYVAEWFLPNRDFVHVKSK